LAKAGRGVEKKKNDDVKNSQARREISPTLMMIGRRSELKGRCIKKNSIDKK
jgi:hypothetical protein